MATLMVCPHDTVRSAEGWYRIVQYVTARLGLELHFELSMDFGEFHANLGKADLAYLNPRDCYKMRREHGFTPILRPAETFDETLIVAAAGDNTSTLASLAGATVATIPPMLQTKLGLRLLAREGVSVGELKPCDSWLGVVRSVWGGEAPFGMIYRDAYEELSEQGKSMVRVLATTDERAAFHCVSVGPALAEQRQAIALLLLGMATDPAGQDILHDIHIPAWAPIASAELARMQALIEE